MFKDVSCQCLPERIIVLHGHWDFASCIYVNKHDIFHKCSKEIFQHIWQRNPI